MTPNPKPFRDRVPGGAAALLALLLGACATVPAPAPTLPAATPPGAWLAPLPAAGIAPSLSGPAFDDPLLPGLIAAAQAASPSLSAAAARVERARANAAAANAALRPAVGAFAQASQGRQTPRAPTATQGSAGLQAAWEVDLFGGNGAARSAASARLLGAGAALQAARVAVAAEVASTYTALRSCEAQRAPTQADADSRAETARLTGLSADAGFTAPADAALARAGAAQSRSTAIAQQAACETLVKALVELTGLSEAALRERLAPQRGRVPAPQQLALPVLPAGLLARRADIAEAAQNVIAAAGDRVVAQARERPQISLSGNLAGMTLRSAAETQSGATWSLGPLSVNFPLFDGGARAAATAAAGASYEEALAAYRGQVRRAVREVEAGLVALRAAEERDADARLAARDFEASLRATEARQRGGLATLFDLEAARRNALAAQAALIDLQRERADAWITLYRALGGGFDEAALVKAERP